MGLEVSQSDWTEWDGLVGQLPHRTVFHRSAWLRSLQGALGLRPLLLKVLDGDRCVAVWPWMAMRKGPIRVVGSPLPGWSTPYLGPLFEPSTDRAAAARALLSSRLLGHWSYAAFRVLDQDADLELREPFERILRFETCYMDLTKPEDALWSNLKSSCRSRIRKARAAGITVRVETTAGYLDEFWEMARQVFAKSQRQPTFTYALLRALHDNLTGAGELLVMSAWHGERRMAVLVLPHDDLAAMYWAGGSRDEGLHLAPNNVLHWEAILECKRRGLARYDFISTKAGPGRFKKTFGPEIAEVCTHWDACRPRFLRRIKDLYERRARQARRLRAEA